MNGKINLIGPIGLLTGGIIGAGVFSLPYVFHTSGLLIGIGMLVLATIAYCFIHLMYADIIIGTPGQHRFVGYIARYLGTKASYLAILMAVVEMVFVMTIYLVLSISFTKLLIPQFSPLLALVLFWAISSACIFINPRRFVFAEVLASVGIILVIGLLFVVGLPKLGVTSNQPLIGEGNIFLPLAAILFALSGRVAIPPLIDHFRKRNLSTSVVSIRKAILLGTSIPAVVYVFFVLSILALSGSVSEDSITGIIGLIPAWLSIAIGVLGLLSLWSSYILVGLDVSNTLKFDLELPLWLRLCVVVVAPIVLYVLGFSNFIGLVGLVGGIFLAIEGVFILLAWLSAREKKSLGGITKVSRPALIFLWLVFCGALIGVLIS